MVPNFCNKEKYSSISNKWDVLINSALENSVNYNDWWVEVNGLISFDTSDVNASNKVVRTKS